MKAFFTLVLILIAAVPVWSQIGLPPPAFNSDYASFASDSIGLSALEIYYQIYTSRLLYTRQEGAYVAHYSVSAVINKNHKQITAAETEGYLHEETYEKTTGTKDFVINSFRFLLPPGKYSLNITLHDLNSDNSIPLETDIVVPDYQAKWPIFSNIEFARQISIPSDTTGAADTIINQAGHGFMKRQWKVIPSCSRIYGDENPHLEFYFEFYRQVPMHDSVQFVYEIRDTKNNPVASDTNRRFIDDSLGFIGDISPEHLRPGPYELVLTALSERSKKLAEFAGKFRISWSALALVEYDFDTAIEQLKYVAKPDEIDKLKKAPKDKRVQLWNEFWKSKDPTPGTDENEVRNEYYRRIAYANEHYSMPGQEGWKSDFGMVYITYGEPDEIERHPFDMENRPYEIWYYYNPRRTFLFVDANGYGEYILQYPYDGDVNKQR